jgi:hypothetical protein
MTYEFYKVFHLAMIFIFLSGAAVLLLAEKKTVFWKMLTGISSFFILVSGMGLIAKLGGGFPPWAVGLLVIWLIVTGLGHLVAKRFPAKGMQTYWVIMVLASLAAYLAIYKPI